MGMWWSRCSAKPRNADRYYATQAEYEAAWRERRQTLFDRYLHATLYGDNGALFATRGKFTIVVRCSHSPPCYGAEMRRRVCETLGPDLRDLGIVVPQNLGITSSAQQDDNVVSKTDRLRSMLKIRRPMRDPEAAIA